MINPILTIKYESEILDLIQNSDDFTTSDLQGVVSCLVNKIMIAGADIIKKEDKILEIYESLDDNEKFGVQYGLFPVKVQVLVTEHKLDQHEVVVGLMKLDQKIREKRGVKNANSNN